MAAVSPGASARLSPQARGMPPKASLGVGWACYLEPPPYLPRVAVQLHLRDEAPDLRPPLTARARPRLV